MYNKEVDNCVSCVLSCGCLSLLVLLWLVAGIWPDPAYIAVKVNEKKLNAIQAQLHNLESLIEHAQWASQNHTPGSIALKPMEELKKKE